jgi:phosphoribosylamine--glycine ligase
MGIGKKLKVLVVGNGAREHVIAWKLLQSPIVAELIVAPGNAGTAEIAKNIQIQPDDIDSLLSFALRNNVDLTVVGPEVPLAIGLTDKFENHGLLVFGPTKQASQIESSKTFAKKLMQESGVPTANAQTFKSFDEASAHLSSCDVPIVIKADGLAAGKGVVVANTLQEGLTALEDCLVKKKFGTAGETVLIEEYLSGEELSVFAFVDGIHVSSLVAACDYKRIYDGNSGPNTGGMGSFTPPHFWDKDLENTVASDIMIPVAKYMSDMGNPYRGILYAGIMLTKSGPVVYEFNCRFGDPEAQVILPRLKTDMAVVMMAVAQKKLDSTQVQWSEDAAVCVVVASQGYPENYNTGFEIMGLDDPGHSLVFHSGTRKNSEGKYITDGGRVLSVVSIDNSVAEARLKTYESLNTIKFEGSFHRSDIALNK